MPSNAPRRDDRDAVREAATSLADLSHRPVDDWTDETRDDATAHLGTLRDAGHLSEATAQDLAGRLDTWSRAGLREGERAELVHDLRNDVLDALPGSVVAHVVGRPPSERDLTGGDPESAWRMVGFRRPPETWDASDREAASYYLAVLADADVYPEHVAGLIERVAEWREGDRETLCDDLRTYATNARDVVQTRADEQAGGWRAEYETTTHRGPDRYPVPGDWTLGIVEGDGISWTRPERPDDPGLEWSPEDRAGTLNEFDARSGDRTVKFDVNGTPVFTVTEPCRDDLMRAIAEVLARVARGEDYHDVDAPEDYGGGDDGEDAGEQNASLDAFGGES